MSIWLRLDQLIDEAPNVRVLRAHKVHLLAARRWRALGLPVPADVAEEERAAAVIALAVPALLARIRAAYEGRIVLLKGPEIATRYPDTAHRSFVDIDLLVEDADLAQRRLIEAGFAEVGNPPWIVPARGSDIDHFVDKQHGRPLRWPGLPLKVELHRWPNWPRWLNPPPVRELLSAAVPSALEIDGVYTLAPEEHALVIAAHSWAHEPLARLRDVLDLALITEGADRERIAQLADRWEIRRLWRSTLSVSDAVFRDGGRRPLSQRVWVRNLDPLRERTVVESHIEGWISCFWAAPLLDAVKLLGSNILWDLRPAAGETWKPKLARTRRAVRDALLPKSTHDRQLGRAAARRLSPSRRWRKPPGPTD